MLILKQARRGQVLALPGVVPEPASRVFSDDRFFPGLIQGVSEALEAADQQLVLTLASSPTSHARIERYALGRHVDGIMIASMHGADPLPTTLHRLGVPVVANVDADPKRTAAAAIEALVRQVSAPVRWDAVVRRLASDGVTTYVEVGPGTVLSGLVKKILEDQARRSGHAKADARIVSFGSPANLAAVVAACST